jgi:hypothetical protein
VTRDDNDDDDYNNNNVIIIIIIIIIITTTTTYNNSSVSDTHYQERQLLAPFRIILNNITWPSPCFLQYTSISSPSLSAS